MSVPEGWVDAAKLTKKEITPELLRNKIAFEYRRGFFKNGYDEEEVDHTLEVFADWAEDIVHERDALREEVRKLRARPLSHESIARAAPQDECPHLAESGDEGPVRELHGGLMTVVRWRCDGCGRIRYDDESLDRLRALVSFEKVVGPPPPTEGGGSGL